MVNHKYNTRLSDSQINYNDDEFIYDNEFSDDEKFDQNKFSKLLYKQFPSKFTLEKLKNNNNNKKRIIKPKNIKINIKNKNKKINDLPKKKYYFNKLKRNCISPTNIKIKRNKNIEENNNIEYKDFNLFFNNSYKNHNKIVIDDDLSEYESDLEDDDISNDDSDSDYNDLRDNNKQKCSQDKQLVKEYENIFKNETNGVEYFKKLGTEEKRGLLEKLSDLNSKATLSVPHDIHIINLNIEEKYKIAVFNKLKNLNSLSNDTSSTEYIKLKNWMDNFTKIPFNNYSSLPISLNDGLDKCAEYIINDQWVLEKLL